MSAGLKERLGAGEFLLGTWVTLADPGVVEILGRAGFRWVAIDGQHAAINPESVRALVQVAQGAGIWPLVRVGSAEAVEIGRALDTGAAGVIVPLVNDAGMARAAARAARYPPQGERSIGLTRAHGYDEESRSVALAEANSQVVVVVQIEHATAVEHLDAILGVEGADAVFIGPADLGASLGQAGEQALEAAIQRVLARARSVGRPIGLPAGTAAQARQRFAQGFQLVSVLTDAALLSGAAKDVCRAVARGLEEGS